MGSGRWSLGLLFVILALLVSLAGAAAAWADDPAYVSSSQAKVANRHALTITAPTGAAMGDALIAQITYVGGSRETITVPLGWTRLYRTDNGTRVGQAVYWKIGGATDVAASSYTWTFGSSTNAYGSIGRYRYVDQADPIAASSAAVSTSSRSTLLTAAGITSPTNGLVIALYGDQVKSTWSNPPSGFAVRWARSDAAPGIAGMDATVSGPTGNKSITGTASNWVAHFLALRPDVTRPSVTVTKGATQADPTNGRSVVFDVVFSEPVTGLTDSSFTYGGTAGGFATHTLTGSGSTYTLTLSGTTAAVDGTLIVSLGAGEAFDAGGNANAASTSTDNSVTYDGTAPTVTLSTPANNAALTSVTSTAITGTASDATSGVATVAVTIQRSSDGLYWTGLGWQPTPYYLAAVGTTNWTCMWNFDPVQQAGSPTYAIQATATDNAANSGSSGAVTGVNVNNLFTLTYAPGAHGTISGTSPQTVAYGGSGTQVRALPDAGYHFVSWSDGLTSAARTDANVTADLSVTAGFAADSFTLTYAPGAHGTISGTSPQTVAYGGSGTQVRALPDAGYHFVSWSDGLTSAARTDANVTADLSVTAGFAADSFTLTYAPGAHGTISGTSPQTVAYGGSGTQVRALPDAGYHFVSWSDGLTSAARTDANVTADLSVTAGFAADSFTLTYAPGAHGTISGTSPQTVAYGGSGTQVRALPDAGYHFVSWSDGLTSAARTDANVTADLSVTAGFAADSFTLTYAPGAHGTISGTSPQTVAYGGSGTQVRALPDAGYHFVSWSDGLTSAARTDANVTADLSVTAGFAADSFTSASGLTVVGKYAYIAAGADGLRIVDVSDPQAPTVVGNCDTPGMASDVSVCWPYAYVADGDVGLQVVDVRDPAHPAIFTSLQMPAAARRLSFSSGPILEDFESTSGFAVWNGTMALDTAHVKHGSASVKLTVAAGGYAELSRGNLAWDLSHERGALQLWVYAKSADLATADPWNLYFGAVLGNDTSGDYFTATSNKNIHEGWNLVRFSAADWTASGSANWSRPIRRLQLSCSAPSNRSLEISFDELRLGVRGTMPAFLWRFDDGYDEIFQDALPYLSNLGQKATMYLRTNAVGTGGRNITLAHLQSLYDAGWAIGNHTSDHTNLTAVDQATAAARISAATNWLISHGFPRGAYHLAYPYDFTNATARAAAAQSGILSAVRAGNANQHLPVGEPLYLNSFTMNDGTPTIQAWSAIIDRAVASGGAMILGSHDFTSTYQNETLPLFRQIADYVAQRHLWTPTIDEWWNTLQMQAQAGEAGAGPWLYVACGDAGVQVVDLADPGAPVLRGRCATGGAEDVAAYDDGALVAAGPAGLQVVGSRDPASPALIGGLSGGSAPSQGVCVRGARTYVAAGSDGLRIISTADPAHPVLLGTLDTPGDARDVTVVGSKAYVADGQAGIQVIDVSDPAHPALVGTHALAAAAQALVVFGDNAYVAVGQGGLQVVALSAGEV